MEKNLHWAEGSPKPEKQRKDAYICPDLHIVITEVVGEVPENAKVPAMVTCTMCKQPAKALGSMGMVINQNLSAHIEWYAPSEADKLIISAGMSKPEQNRFFEMTNKGVLVSRKKQ